ncbi:uncharacterized protein ACA1_114480 [Acanthamoeba castellanii str. Neff]|uniref:RING-type domain-containing protein n=1 Tax=Acanthamoeba castellanii (strain ATCC 30010 / Neff) TaxID=1257118 RepID=L8H3J7_ACACF|nr:uncharacterized protein ACA1_114480 [Acanthamoeba castellanii str. Neff]ELR20069.1 hypothetical protein ACA1_114480 [Acanthamoeba castellanii str. Neff]
MRAVRGLPGFRHFFGSRRGGGHGAGITSDRKDGPIGEMSDDEASSAAATHGKKLVGDMEDEMDIDNECCICLIDMEERKFRGKMDCCDHVVCWCCIQEWAQTSRSCPICQRSYNKCKKTTPKAKKGRKHTKPNKGKKQRSLWEKPQQPPNLAAQSSWGDMGDEEADVDVDAGEEEVVVFPMRDSRGDDDVGVVAVDGAAAAADADASSSSSSSSSSDDSDSRGSRRSNEEEANEEGNDMIIVNIINDDDSPGEQAEEEEENEEEQEEVAVEASRVDEAVAVAVGQAGISSSPSLLSSVSPLSSLSTLSLSTSSVSTRDVSDEETHADNNNNEEEEEEEATTTSGNNFIAEGADWKDKGKELEEEEEEEDDEEEEEEEEDRDKEEEEWERKDSESDDSDDDDSDEDEDDANGPLDSC